MLMLAVLLACDDPQPPECDAAEDEFACFRGNFISLLQQGIEGVQVCVPDVEDVACVLTDDEGGFVLAGLPQDTDLAVTGTLDGMVPTAFLQNSGHEALNFVATLYDVSFAEFSAERMGTVYDPDAAHLAFTVFHYARNPDEEELPPHTQGVTFSLSSDSGVPYYMNGLFLPDQDLTSTSSSGFAGVVNLAPGDYELSLESSGGLCGSEHYFSFAFQEGEPVPFVALAGFTSYLDLVCPPASDTDG
jgi:hypothetical protein